MRVGVLGAGTMGAGIAQLSCLAGNETLLHDADPAALEAGRARVDAALAKGAARGRWSEAEGRAALGLLSPAPRLRELRGCELVIEAVPEDLALKRELLSRVAAAVGSRAVLATNTSSLRVTAIAAPVPAPERVVGMHFFNPPALMRLVEIVAAERSSEGALELARAAAEAMGRTPVRARDAPGFIANRLARPFYLEPLRMLAAGVAPAERIDRIVRLGGGFRMGPFELIDLIGLDVNQAIARSIFEQGGEPERWRPSPVQERLIAAGRLGRKSGHGYHPYGEGGRGDPERGRDPEPQIPAPTLEPAELARIDPDAGEVLGRLFAQIANETAFAIEDRIASLADMETAVRLGLNWPLGPLGFAARIGSAAALELLERLERDEGAAYAPAPLLRRAAARGAELSALSPRA